MSEKSIPRIPCPCQFPASEPEKHMAAGVDAGRATWRRCLDSPRLFLPFRTDIGALMYVWSTQTSPESTVFPAFSGILCIFRFHRSAVCSNTCTWYAACLRAAPSDSMVTSLRIWDGLSLDE